MSCFGHLFFLANNEETLLGVVIKQVRMRVFNHVVKIIMTYNFNELIANVKHVNINGTLFNLVLQYL